MKKPTDTSAQPASVHLKDAMTVGTSNAIELSESMGQAEMVESTVIPVDGSDKLLDLGFVIGPVVKDDPIFCECELPKGWKRDGSDHSMWSYIVDERGFRRVAIFYKAAFYDRNAHVSVVSEPETRAQNETYRAFSDEHPWPQWECSESRDGDNVVRIAKELDLDPEGKAVYDKEAGEWKFTGRTRQRVIDTEGQAVAGTEETP